MSNMEKILGITGVILICVIFMVVMYVFVHWWTRWMEMVWGKDVPESAKILTPTQKFILAASSPTRGNQYKCVIDIWDTHTSDTEVEQVKRLFEWGWGEFTYENAKKMVDHCLHEGYQQKYREYCSGAPLSSEYTDFERQLLEETKQKYPKQGMLAWDLVRALSVLGGAYMGGIMEYEEAAQIAMEVCKLLQNNFSSWDDMVGSYTLGYQYWRGKKKKDRLKYYQRMKKTWIYQIPWNTPLREEELSYSIGCQSDPNKMRTQKSDMKGGRTEDRKEQKDGIKKERRKIAIMFCISFIIGFGCIGFSFYRIYSFRSLSNGEAVDISKVAREDVQEGQYVKIESKSLPVMMTPPLEQDCKLYFVTDVNGQTYIVSISGETDTSIVESLDPETGRIDKPYQIKGIATNIDEQVRKSAIGNSFKQFKNEQLNSDNFSEYLGGFYIKENYASQRTIEIYKILVFTGLLFLVVAFGYLLPHMVKDQQ